ncbi:branched-chain amino acid ABC transporter permease [Kineosporia sp. NBRC 101731]|uniref:branched-chain amino acid ABC transporter permease n=1 Tax=Kineosporia sp. NBRC 101731 TaxID=3032199 RepID=UPI0024A3B54F|nr:branched-chain amino acid ABC transporter permease [Kineosporia sp. NBRC 101731]GLY30657.1 branched-chain amino acid ABC transporter permease [Kineosporia sp. NBRC 101731]
MTQTAIAASEVKPRRLPRETAVSALGLLLVAAVVVWVLYEAIKSPQEFASLIVAGAGNGALYALIALGYTMVYGIIELINFSHGDLFMLATVLSGIVCVSVFNVDSFGFGAVGAVALALLISMAAAALVNVAAERVAYRRLRRAPKLAPLITAVGLSFMYQWFGQRQFMTGSAPKQWSTMFGDDGFNIGDVRVPYTTVTVIAITIPLLLLMVYIVQRTRAGKAMRAVAQDQDAARLMGIDVDRTITFVFALGGGLAGAAGLLYLQSVGTSNYNLGFRLGLIAFTAAVLGGIGNLQGAVLGGFLLGILSSLNDGMLLGQQWSMTVVFTVLILLMVFKPEGILGSPTTEKV